MAKRLKLFTIAAVMLSIPVMSIFILGRGFVTLESLQERTLLFHTVLTVPLCAGAALAAIALLPRIVWINLAVGVGFWLAIEIGIGMVVPEPQVSTGEPQAIGKESYYERDSSIGYRLVPDNKARHISTFGSTTEFDVIYEIDSFGRRATPTNSEAKPNQFLLFFGCSNTFGEGLEQRETIPYFVGDLAREYRSYNYGVHGYGPSQALDVTHIRDLSNEVTEKRGIAFFQFIPAHLWRVVGASNVAPTWGQHFSYYSLNDNGYPERHGDFSSGRPLVTLFYEFTRHSNLLATRDISLPLDFDNDDFRLTSAILRTLKDYLKDTFELDAFHVTVPPVGKGWGTELSDKMIAALKADGVSVLDLRDLYAAGDRQFWVAEHNPHQSALANQVLARSIVDQLGIARGVVPEPVSSRTSRTPADHPESGR